MQHAIRHRHREQDCADRNQVSESNQPEHRGVPGSPTLRAGARVISRAGGALERGRSIDAAASGSSGQRVVLEEPAGELRHSGDVLMRETVKIAVHDSVSHLPHVVFDLLELFERDATGRVERDRPRH